MLISIANKGVTGMNGESLPLAKHKAIKVLDAGGVGGCGAAIETSDATSSAIIGVIPTAGGPAEQACPRAVEVATVVDSTLP